MIPCQELKAKRLIRVKTTNKTICIKQSTESYKYKIAKSSSPSVSWKLNTSLTQKDTMDKGSWIKNSERKAWGGLKRKKKSKSTKKYKMAWEWGTNEYFCLPYVTILWCPSWELPEDRGKKWNPSSWPHKSYLDFEILVSIFLNWTIIND